MRAVSTLTSIFVVLVTVLGVGGAILSRNPQEQVRDRPVAISTVLEKAKVELTFKPDKLFDAFFKIDFFSIPGKLCNAAGLSGRPPAFIEIVKRGYDVLPQLLAHLEDPRPTRLRFSLGYGPRSGTAGLRGEYWYHSVFLDAEYDARRADHPYGTLNNIWRPVDGEMRLVDSYRVSIGDLCYMAVGDIVNRKLFPFRYQPTNCVVINSPVLNPALAQAVRRDWRDICTMDQHRKALVNDISHPWRAEGALERLWYFYPEQAKSFTLHLLSSRYFDEALVRDCVERQLLCIENPKQRQQAFVRFKQAHPFSERAILKFLLAVYYTANSASRSRIAKGVLQQFYPSCDPEHPPLPTIAFFSDYLRLIESLPPETITDPHLNSAIARVFSSIDFAGVLRCSDQESLDRFASVCMQRLVGKALREEFEAYCRRRLAELAAFPNGSPQARLREFWTHQLDQILQTVEVGNKK